MLRARIERKAAEAEKAIRALAEVTMSITLLQDDDLLDLADIFAGSGSTVIGTIASAGVQRRNLTS